MLTDDDGDDDDDDDDNDDDARRCQMKPDFFEQLWKLSRFCNVFDALF